MRRRLLLSRRARRLLLCLLDGLHLLKGPLSLLENLLQLGDFIAFFAVLQPLVVSGLERCHDPLRRFQIRTNSRHSGCLGTALCRRFGVGFGGWWLGLGLLHFCVLGPQLLDLLWQLVELLFQLAIPVGEWANLRLVVLFHFLKLFSQSVLLVVEHMVLPLNKRLVLAPNLVNCTLYLFI